MSSVNTCNSTSNQIQSYCTGIFTDNCTACNYFTCTQCTAGYSVNTITGSCCPSPANNIANCAQYSVVWSATGCSLTFTCTACSFGTFLVIPYKGAQPQCTKLPCSIQNCLYCYQTANICIVCNSGYNYVNGNCVSYSIATACTTPNCVACNTNNQCTSCLTGYLLYNGTCVCKFQNCLSCIGNAFCTACASPTIATITAGGVCLPQIYYNVLCTIPNCLNCMNVNMCAQCDAGFSLNTAGACIQNVCDKSNNCTLCNSNQTTCYVCNPGFIPSKMYGPACIPVASNYSCQVAGCAVCNSQPTQCQTCSPYYSLNNGICTAYSCIPNCVTCLSDNSCLVCQVGFYLSTANTCLPGNTANTIACPTGTNAIAGCVGCQQTTVAPIVTICILCQWGLQPSSNGLSCVAQTCSVPNCQICIQNQKFNNGLQMCLVCQQGYSINSYFQCVSVSPALTVANCSGIYNCLYCAYNNYCDLCVSGWNATNGVCQTNTGCTVSNCASCSSPSVCYSCATNYQLSNNICTPICNIQGCSACATLTTCLTCAGNLQLLNNSTSCGCLAGFVQSNNQCSCPSGQTVSNNTCVACNVINCQNCSSQNTCQTCQGNLVLINNTCGCQDSTFTQNGTQCTCPSGTTLFTTNNTCVGCNVTNCQTCSSQNNCQTCQGNLVLINNTCGCQDSTFTQNGTQCTCPSGTTLFTTNNTCVGCNVTNCQTCSSQNNCQTCVGNLILSNNNTCGCPTGLVYYQ